MSKTWKMPDPAPPAPPVMEEVLELLCTAAVLCTQVAATADDLAVLSPEAEDGGV